MKIRPVRAGNCFKCHGGQSFSRFNNHTFSEQLSAVTDAAVHHVLDHFRKEISGAARTKIRDQLKGMLRHPDLHAAYAGFFDFIAEFDLLKRDAKGTYEWADVFPLIYLPHRRS